MTNCKNSDLLISMREEFESIAAELQKKANEYKEKADFCRMKFNELVSAASDKDRVKISKFTVLDYIETLQQPITNAELITHFFGEVDKVEREKLIKAMSVTLDNLRQDEKILREKKAGERGNRYTINKKASTV